MFVNGGNGSCLLMKKKEQGDVKIKRLQSSHVLYNLFKGFYAIRLLPWKFSVANPFYFSAGALLSFYLELASYVSM